ncbi:AraC family transcriptional regulator [Lysobacter silvisoli]|uniref:AraC family transcriptional regulator n=1 Tax=Lysobacter silvisoli TaxID=2293254 RepID=A0A371K1S4_9GAMM|nr:AraC family transcriptional regulator [Lysobacter silvisoli]RDZ27834.1 AraC family transcriptional regulator [Lysobacter silvisoli]
MADRLEALFERFSVRAQVFQAGVLCGINDLAPDGDSGQLHLIQRGPVAVYHGDGATPALQVEQPSLLLYPRPLPHRFVSDPHTGAQLTCAHLRFDGGSAHPIAAALPDYACLPLEQVPALQGTLALLFEEAFDQRCGRRALLDRLFEVVLIQVLRHLMDHGQTQAGMLAGLGHPRLRLALVAMHEAPAREWTLDALAATAGMSRSVFANSFREAVGSTPGAYLQQWRVALAQRALRQGRPLKRVAEDVGYGSESTLSRAFKAQLGVSPREWKQGLA